MRALILVEDILQNSSAYLIITNIQVMGIEPIQHIVMVA